jgi:hemerythrin-like domain-containing protein
VEELALPLRERKEIVPREDIKMMSIGPMMIEHRLIERMIEAMKVEIDRIGRAGEVDPVFVEKAVDFIRTYADRCHHGKEEDILFRELKKKELSGEHARIMIELEGEHRLGRKMTGQLVEATKRYVNGDEGSLASVVDCMTTLVDFYPVHIEKEDKHFFFPVMEYFSDDEKNSMLEEGNAFDKELIHLKYKEMVDSFK